MEFETLANEHKDAVYRQMIRVCGNHADAEDVLVEALLKAYRHLDQLRETDAFHEMKGLLMEAMQNLPPEYRSVYEMRDLEDIPGDRVAKHLGLSLAAMKSRLHRAREMVMQHVDARLNYGSGS